MFCCTAPCGKLAFLCRPLADQAAGLKAYCSLLITSCYCVLWYPTEQQHPISERSPQLFQYVCQEIQKLLAATSHSCCDTLPAVMLLWCMCFPQPCLQRECPFPDKPLNAIVLSVQRATKYQENSLYIILAVKSNLQCRATKAKVQAMDRLFSYGEGFRAWEKNSL